MAKLTIATNRGSFLIDADQIVGMQKMRGHDGSEGTEILISIGVIGKPRLEVMRDMANAIEEGERRVQPVAGSRIIIPDGH